MFQRDDFYVILPSSDSPSAYTITFKEAISLDPDYNWHVAMTEMIYNISSLNVVQNFEFKYTTAVALLSNDLNYQVILRYYPDSNKLTQEYRSERYKIFNNCVLQFDVVDGYLHISTARRFKLEYIDKFNSDLSGFGDQEYIESYRENDRWIVKAPNKIKHRDNRYAGAFRVVFWDVKLTHIEKDFSSLSQLNDINDLITYMKDNFTDIFQQIEIRDGKFYMKLHSNITELSFCKELKSVFGLDNDYFTNIGMYDPYVDNKEQFAVETTGVYEPSLYRAVGLNIYVYASICEPIQVGQLEKQLLKCFMADLSNDDMACRKSCVVNSPIYIPLSTSTIESINIRIRDENDKLVKFLKDAWTIITLHFKKM